jgi:hypothetical protein
MNKKTVSLEVCAKRGRDLLLQYVSEEYVSALDERVYLRKFHHYVKRLRGKLGKQQFCTIHHPADLGALQTLPRKLRLYRGYYEPVKREGISWSLSRKVAEGFAYARAPWEPASGPPMVVTGWCYFGSILAYSNRRQEEEVIVDPADVHDIKNIKVRAQPPFPVASEPLDFLLRTRQHHGSEGIDAPT